MVTRKGRTTAKKSTGKGKPERPECTPVLSIQTDALVKAWQLQSYVDLSSRRAGVKEVANSLSPRLKVLHKSNLKFLGG